MSAVAIPVPPAKGRAILGSENSFVGSSVVDDRDNGEFLLPMHQVNLAGKSILVIPAQGTSWDLLVNSVVLPQVSASHRMVAVASAIRTNQGLVRLTASKTLEEPTLSRSEKIQAFLEGASSFFAFGGERPKESTEKERAARIAGRRANYRRYVTGREN